MILALATTNVPIDGAIAGRAREFGQVGYGPYDALRLAAAESAGAVLFSTDDTLLKKANRGDGTPKTQVRNPLSWIQEQESWPPSTK